MRGRAEVDEALAPAEMPGRLVNELYTHALDTRPEECCGLIIGNRHERHQRLVRCRNEMTQRHQQDPDAYPRDGGEAFYMNEHDYVDAQKKAEAGGLEVTAVYHSHVGSAAYLSEMDLLYAESELFPFPDAAHIVISVSAEQERGMGTVRGLGIFQRERRNRPFIGRSVKPLPS